MKKKTKKGSAPVVVGLLNASDFAAQPVVERESDDCAPIALLTEEEQEGRLVEDPDLVPATLPGEPTPEQEDLSEDLSVGLALDAEDHAPPLIESEPPATDAPDAPPVVAMAAEMPEVLSVACAALGLVSDHVRKHAPLDAGRIRILTHGGASITWPDDRDKYAARPLTQAQKDGIVTSTAHVVGLLQKASGAARKTEPRK